MSLKKAFCLEDIAFQKKSLDRQGFLGIPNLLTLIRIACIPVIVLLLQVPRQGAGLAAGAVFAFAAITDMVDGIVARHYNSVTALGKLLDPIADKLLVSITLIMLVSLDRVPGWAASVIVTREILITGMRALFVQKGKVLASEFWGKLKAVLQYLSIIGLCVNTDLLGIPFGLIGYILLWPALGLTIYSGVLILARQFHELL